MSFPLLHVISPQGFDTQACFTDTVSAMQAACGTRLAVHLRGSSVTGRRLFDLTCAVAAGAVRHGGWCVVNDRVDIALAGGAQAAQLGQRSMSPEVVRGFTGTRLVLGRSVHSAEEAREAAALGANYVVLGTIFPSLTHPGATPLGASEIARCRGSRIPVVAIGGVNIEGAASVMAAGASGVAVIRAIWDARDPVAEAARLVETLEKETR